MKKNIAYFTNDVNKQKSFTKESIFLIIMEIDYLLSKIILLSNDCSIQTLIYFVKIVYHDILTV